MATVNREEIIAKCTPEMIAARDMGAIAAVVNLNRTRRVKVPIADIQAYLQANGLWWMIKAAAADADHPGNQAAIATIEVATARYENIDLDLSFVGYVFSSLVTAQLIAQTNLDEINAMGVIADPAMEQEVCRVMEGM